MKASEFNKLIRGRIRAAESELPELVAAYERVLAKVDREALKQFRSQTLVAANWQPPPEGNLTEGIVDASVAAYSGSQIEKIHRKVVLRVAGPTFVKLGISWDVTNPFVASLLDATGKRIGAAVDEAVTPRLREIILGAYERGLSVQDTEALISEKLTEFRPASARMLARTDLNGLANGASVAAAKVAGVQMKQWVTAADEKVREQHVEADGQVVPVDQPFQVCGEEAMYPGDPALSDDCACNCRCTVVYVESPAATTASAALPTHSNGWSASQPVSVNVAAATTSAETDAVVRQMAELVEQLASTLARLEQPRTRRVIVNRDADGDIVGMTIRED